MTESFAEFKESFSYGSRSDLSFKFFKGMNDADVAAFLAQILDLVGEAYDTGDVAPIIEAAIDAQAAAYAPTGKSPWTYEDGPFTIPAGDLSTQTVGLLTSSGHYPIAADPEPLGVAGMTQGAAEGQVNDFLKATPVLSEIPGDLPDDEIAVRHPGYDVRSVQRDPNVAFPREHLRALVADGTIGGVAESSFSFVGATSQRRLLQEIPEWADRMKAAGADVVLLVPV